jgi:PTS system nitrogen regulatory IIA component
MQIIDLLKKEYIIRELSSTNKAQVLSELSTAVSASTGIDAGKIASILEEREKLGTTGIGDGVAIPHGKLESIGETIVCFGKSPAGIPFNAMDGKLVYLFFVLVAPENVNGKHLKALAKISRMLKDEKFRADLLEADTVDSLYRIIKIKDGELL